MESIASKEGRRRSKTVFLCHCDRSFSSSGMLEHHAYVQHQQGVLSLKAFLTASSQVYQISRFNRVRNPFQGNQDHPIEIPDSPIPLALPFPNPIPMDEDKVIPIPPFLLEIPPEAPSPLPKEAGTPAVVGKGEAMNSQVWPDVAKLDLPEKVVKRRGRKPKFLTEILKVDDPAMQRCSEMLMWFTSKLSDGFGLPGLDFREGMSRANESKLCSQACRYIASWEINSTSELSAATFPELRDRLLVLNVVLQGEQAYLRWRGVGAVEAGDYFSFFNYFMANFLPALLLERRVQKWIRTNHAHVLNRRDVVYEEILAFLRWWNRNDRTNFAVHRNPLLDFKQVFAAEGLTTRMKAEEEASINGIE